MQYAKRKQPARVEKKSAAILNESDLKWIKINCPSLPKAMPNGILAKPKPFHKKKKKQKEKEEK